MSVRLASCDNKRVRNVRTFLDLLLGVDGLLLFFFFLLLFLLFLFIFLVVLGVGLGSLLNQISQFQFVSTSIAGTPRWHLPHGGRNGLNEHYKKFERDIRTSCSWAGASASTVLHGVTDSTISENASHKPIMAD